MIKVKAHAIILVLTALLFGLVSTGFAAREKITLDNADIVGAGATFPAPLYQRWIKEFRKKQADFTLYYDAVGSGDGTKRFMAEQTDFGASDAAMTDEQMAQVKSGVQLIPATAGIIVLAYHLPDVPGELRLSREIYTDIFLGKIRYWDDERIQQLNPHLKLPKLNIVTVTRSDSSGTTWAFTNHLNTISSKWSRQGPGVGKKVDWPGNSMASRYNEGIATRIKLSWGSIGYVEYGIAKRAGLALATLENKAGQYVKPNDNSGTTTLANTSTEMPPNLRMFLPDPDGDNSYPIVTYTWLLLYKTYSNQNKARQVKQFVNWGLTEGQKYAAEYGYAPLPEPVATTALKALAAVK
jgi:phosphate transport system substrate-binding protein